MKAVLISIKPKYCELIANKKKTIEIRKTEPKLRTPFKCYIYCTNTGRNLVLGDRFDGNSFITEYAVVSGYSRERANEIWGVMNGKVIGEFICDGIIDMHDHGDAFIAITDINLERCCLTYEQLHNYANGKPLYGWHISDLIMYDKPKEINDFKRYNRTEENSPCAHTKWLYEPCDKCKECNLTRPPQSWCYVEV